MHIKSYLERFLTLFILIIMATGLLSCSDNDVISDKRIMMSTTVEIKVLGKDKSKLKQVIHHAFKEVEKIDNLMNYYDKSSALSELNNQAKNVPVRVDKDIYYVVDKCIKFGKMTRGGFDITATSLDKYDGFEGIVLSQDNQTIYFKEPKLKIDLSAAAKGYAVDKAILILKNYGVEHAMVNAGGDVRVMGRYNRKAWSIGIRNPKIKNKIICTIELTDKAVATSGNYLRPHIIDTLKNDVKNYRVLSSTVIANDCLTADILATSLFVMGKDGIDLVENLEEVEALLIIEKDGQLKLIESSDFYKYKIKEYVKN